MRTNPYRLQLKNFFIQFVALCPVVAPNMTDKIRFEKLNIKLPEISNEPIPVENYKIPIHNTQSRLNPENNPCNFNDYNCFTMRTVAKTKTGSNILNKKEYDVLKRPKRLRTEENFNTSTVCKPIRREHTDLGDDPFNNSIITSSTETFQLHFTEEQLQLYKKNRATLSYLSTDSGSSATFTSSSTAQIQDHSSDSTKLYHSSSSSLEGSQHDTSDNSTFILPRRQSLDNLSVASSLASPEFDSGNYNNTNSSDGLKNSSLDDDDNEYGLNAAEGSFSISTTTVTTVTTTTTTRTSILDESQQILGAIQEEESDDLSIPQ